MHRLVAILLLVTFSSGCAHVVDKVPVVPERPEKRPELAPLPQDPATVALPTKTPPDDWLKAQEKGVPAPDNGILVSEAHAIRDGYYRLGYKELRAFCEADRLQWKAQRDLYEWDIAAAREALKKAEPNWWDQHKGEIGLLGGLFFGIALTIGGGIAISHAK